MYNEPDDKKGEQTSRLAPTYLTKTLTMKNLTFFGYKDRIDNRHNQTFRP